MAALLSPKAPRFPAWFQTSRRRTRRGTWLLLLLLGLCLEAVYHVWSFRVVEPREDPDEPFQRGCRVPDTSAPRANATIVMLTRNEDLELARHTIQSLEARFNRFFHYPVIFLNEKPFDENFENSMRGIVSGEAIFETLKWDMWNFPKWVDPVEARASFKAQGEARILHAELESYHHMCRFFSG